MVRRLEDAHILRLDDIPKVAQADGLVYPIYLDTRDIARVFHITPDTAKRWIGTYGIPFVRIGSRIYIEVAAFNEWVTKHSYTAAEARSMWLESRARHRVAENADDDESDNEIDLGARSAEDEDERLAGGA